MTRTFILLFIIAAASLFPQTDSVITYFDGGGIKSVIHYRDNVRDGEARFYYNNGNLKEETSYLNGRVEGTVLRYYENGKLNEMFVIEDGKREGPTSLFDSAGAYLKDLDYENGILVVDKIVLDEGKKEETTVTNEVAKNEQPPKVTKKKQKINQQNPLPPKIEEEHNYEDDPAFYKTVEVMPEPIGGMQAIYKKISYPKDAKEEGIEGTVKILTFIDRDGEVLDAQVVDSLGYGCDESARLAIFYHRFTPGMIKGQRVKVQMEIPIEFKLPKED